ncbi:MAG: endolytic transglycosylase MltG, partial [Defluviitaleaceae bacterium]|nr:endolytic transglycosylase MltG [Defluviitaleaceae bacterium]
LYVIGICFNIMVFVLVVYFVHKYSLEGYHAGEDFSARLTSEKPNMEVEFVLIEDTPIEVAAQMLEKMQLIESAYLYRLELLLKGSSTYYKAGTYILNKNMNSTDINVTLRTQPKAEPIPENKIVILEGWNIRDIATYLEDRDLMDKDDFIAACEAYGVHFWFLRDIPRGPNWLEGYLFPDTYFVSGEPTPDEIIFKMLSRFDDIFTDEYRQRAAELGMTVNEIVVIASIIEKEVRIREERPIVAEVIYNRLKQNIKLEMCSTVLYVLDKKRDRLLYADLEVVSPYNTYINAGLPPAPIASPGADCIKAALYPESGNRLYFVLQDDETGRHFFTHDYNAFLKAKEQYNQLF